MPSGKVKWFDQKKGFGFIKIITPKSEFLDREVFVHYSNINSVNSFKKLYPGENVSFDVIILTCTALSVAAFGAILSVEIDIENEHITQ